MMGEGIPGGGMFNHDDGSHDWHSLEYQPKTVYVVIYDNSFLEEFAVQGVFTDKEKAKALQVELTESRKVSDGHYEIEEWELNMTKIESNVRGMIRNFEKEIQKAEAEYEGACHTDNAYQQIDALDRIKDRRRLIERLQKAIG
jgi:hypothetical protein